MAELTDRELLERAAKAAGIEHTGYTSRYYDPGLLAKETGGDAWNPLTNDADAFRLAVKLGIYVCSYSHQYGMALAVTEHTLGSSEFWEEGEMFAATRRAIVRAATSLATEGGV